MKIGIMMTESITHPNTYTARVKELDITTDQLHDVRVFNSKMKLMLYPILSDTSVIIYISNSL